MQLSIREVSRFVIGTTLLRARAMQSAANAQMLTFDNVAASVLQSTEDGKQLRFAVEALADSQDEWFRNSPPHAMSSERVMNSRNLEVAALRAINGAVVTTVLYGPKASAGDGPAAEHAITVYSDTYNTVDAAPGSTQERRAMVGLLHSQAMHLSPNPEKVRTLFVTAEKRCLARQADAILSRYQSSMSRSQDFDM